VLSVLLLLAIVLSVLLLLDIVLSVLLLLDIVLSVLRFGDFGYPFGIKKTVDFILNINSNLLFLRQLFLYFYLFIHFWLRYTSLSQCYNCDLWDNNHVYSYKESIRIYVEYIQYILVSIVSFHLISWKGLILLLIILINLLKLIRFFFLI
jgi:hypothetical protein